MEIEILKYHKHQSCDMERVSLMETELLKYHKYRSCNAVLGA
jgi:hypothetical protein